MNKQESTLARNASTAVILPIAGLLGGLCIGGLRAKGRGPDEIAQIACVIKWGITGFFAGLAFVVLLAVPLRKKSQFSMGTLMVLIAIAGVLTWFFARVLSGVIGYEGF